MLLQLHLQLVNLGGQDKVVFTQPADGVCPELNGDIAISCNMQVGVMAIVLGNLGDPVEEIHTGHEVGDRPLLADPLVVAGEFPAGKFLELLLRFSSE